MNHRDFDPDLIERWGPRVALALGGVAGTIVVILASLHH